MQLYLVQHGEAEPEQVDPDRPLTARGGREVKQMAEFLRPMRLLLQTLWHSGKLRARQTAELLAPAVQIRQGVVERHGLGPQEPIKPVRKQLQSAAENLMIVGHMPFLGKLASALLTGEEAAELVAIQPGGVLCLARGERDRWSVQWMLIPQLLH